MKKEMGFIQRAFVTKGRALGPSECLEQDLERFVGQDKKVGP